MFSKDKFFSKIGIKNFIVKDLSNIFYLTGLKVSYGFYIFTENKDYLLLDGRYFNLAKTKLKNKNVEVLQLKKDYTLKDFILEKNIKQFGIESDAWTLSEFDSFIKNFKNIEIKKIYRPFDEFIEIKTEQEIKKIKHAIGIIESVYKQIYLNFQNGKYIGKSEFQVRKDIIKAIFDFNGEGESFDSIVAFGKGSAIPHWQTSNNILESNNAVLIDMGAIYEGYCSDFTRSFWFGEKIDPLWQKIYDIVRKAHDEVWKLAKRGVKIADLDKKARQIIDEAGYGKYFNHSLGHGIGINVHEAPYIYEKNEKILQPGMVFTIEPGIYLPGKFGVRWENIKIIE